MKSKGEEGEQWTRVKKGRREGGGFLSAPPHQMSIALINQLVLLKLDYNSVLYTAV
jgi:hypothetical protein